MNTEIVKVDPESTMEELREKLAKAGEILRKGGLVAFPTETVYGLGGDAMHGEASSKIYAAKGRPSDNPLIIHISDFEEIYNIGKDIPEEAKLLSDAFWPGPLTMVVKKKDEVPYTTTGGLDTVAVRLPSHPVARALIKESGCPIAAPSANTSGRPSPTKAEHVIEDMSGRIEMIIDGGSCGIGLESTIVDLTEKTPMILRPGYITLDMVRNVIGRCEMDPGIMESDSLTKPKAPGMKYKHYAPKAQLTIVDGAADRVIAKINELTKLNQAEGKKVGIIATEETIGKYSANTVVNIGSRDDEDTIARNLFAILRDFDNADVDRIYSESFVSPAVGQAIMNRLLKAAGHSVIEV